MWARPVGPRLLSQQLQWHLSESCAATAVISHSSEGRGRTVDVMCRTGRQLMSCADVEVLWTCCFDHEFMLESVALLLCCRFLAGSSTAPPPSGQPLFPPPDSVESFIPAPPPNLSKLINHHQSPRERKASPSSLPGRLSRALSLGTIPSLSRTGMGWDVGGTEV